jgi:tRNA pseudouridine38-40 synthase
VDRRTIQGEVERALERITQESVRIAGSGRTDAGVHARGQVISFPTGWARGTSELERALNAVLPRDIVLRDLERVSNRFHARYSARSRIYYYSLYTGRVRAPLLQRYAWYVREPIDLAAMKEASGMLEGERDFAAFGQPPTGDNTVRRVRRAVWREKREGFDQAFAKCVEFLQFEIEGNAFLRGMVRRIVGTLLLVGIGRLAVSDFYGILEGCDISRAGAPAPACGLCLWRVRYATGDG